MRSYFADIHTTLYGAPSPRSYLLRKPSKRLVSSVAAFQAVVILFLSSHSRLPKAAQASDDSFSAILALETIREIAQRPHPVGSIEHKRVRDVLLKRLNALGPRVRVEEQVGRHDGYELRNLIAHLSSPGDGSTLLLAAHYDTTPRGPGASDDSVGVAVLLEVARLLVKDPEPRGDVVLLLSDGEELGRKGAQLFASDHAVFEHIDVFLNVEAAGNGGPPRLIQVTQPNGILVRLAALAAPQATATSITEELLDLLPNTTDFQVFSRSGLVGYDFALVAGSAAYHAPDDRIEHLDPRSVQALGDAVWGLTSTLVRTPVEELSRHPHVRTIFDPLCAPIVHYPRQFDSWIAGFTILLLAALIIRKTQRRLVSWPSLLSHVARIPALAGFIAFMSVLFATAFVALAKSFGQPLPGAADALAVGNAATFGAAFLGLGASACWHQERAVTLPNSQRERILGGLLLWALGAGTSLYLAPGSAHLCIWPLALAVAAQWVPDRWEWARPLILAPILLLLLPVLWAIVQLASIRLPIALGVGTGLACLAGSILAPALSFQSSFVWRLFVLVGVCMTLAALAIAHTAL